MPTQRCTNHKIAYNSATTEAREIFNCLNCRNFLKWVSLNLKTVKFYLSNSPPISSTNQAILLAETNTQWRHDAQHDDL
jgi:hypothetical protein